MAYVGDVTPHDRLQQILGRYISGQILGQLFGQAAGGVLGDLLGWRNVFFVLAGLFALAAAGLVFELAVNPQTRKAGSRSARGVFGGYAAVLTNPFASIVLIAGFLEGGLAWGAFAYIGAHLHLRFGLSFSLVGAIVACFGIGGLIYAALVKLLVYRLGQPGLAVTGGIILAIAYLELAVGRFWWLAPIATTAIGLGFYMLHNTLQTNATQMTPQARGTAVGLFSSALHVGQTAGVAAGALVIDRVGAEPLFLATAIALPALAVLVCAGIETVPAGRLTARRKNCVRPSPTAPSEQCRAAAGRRRRRPVACAWAKSGAWPWCGGAPATSPAAA